MAKKSTSKEIAISKLDKNITKAEIKSQAAIIKQSILDGYIDPVETLVIAKKMQEFGKTVEGEIKGIANEKAQIGKNETLSIFNANVIRKMVKTEYDFGNCGDPFWNRVNSEIENLKKQLKAREDFLKTIQKPMMIADEFTEGEEVTLNPPIKYQTEGLSITIK